MLKDSAERSPAMELLAQLRSQIAAEELKVRRRIDRAANADEARQAWADFNGTVEPIRREINAVTMQLAAIEAAKVRPVVLVEDDDGYIPFEGRLHRNRGPRKLSQDEADKLRELVKKLRLNEPGRMGKPSRGVGQ